jgi:5-methylthioadenosine/S-adenosylhomocysteine deaminase
MTPIEYLYSLGIFSYGGTAAHCVWITEGDAKIMANQGVTAATCPSSNLKLASGVMNAPMLMQQGVNIAIGTDSVASNNSLSILEEIKLFSILSKEKYMDPTLITPKEALFASAKAGFISQGRPDSGEVEVGKRADLVVLDLRSPGMNPIHDLKNNIVYSAGQGEVLLTMVDGEILYDRGEFTTIDIEKAIFEVAKSTKRICGELNATS